MRAITATRNYTAGIRDSSKTRNAIRDNYETRRAGRACGAPELQTEVAVGAIIQRSVGVFAVRKKCRGCEQ
jgi:hypothetical protein